VDYWGYYSIGRFSANLEKGLLLRSWPIGAEIDNNSGKIDQSKI